MDLAVELRHSPRVPVGQMVIGLPDGDRYVHGNVSTGGIGFHLDEIVALRPGDRLAVRLTIPEVNAPISLSATVCHVRFSENDGRLHVGACFTELDELIEYPLFRFVEEAALSRRARSPSGVLRPA